MNDSRFNEINEFLEDRREALWSMNKAKLAAFIVKHGVRVPSNEETFWAWVHKQRYHDATMPKGARDYSEQWLSRHGFSTDLILHEVKHGRETR